MDNVTIAVVIPAYNEEEHLGALLHALLVQTRIPDEIIVVDDGSADGTAEVAKQYADRGVILLEEPHEGVNAARHKGTMRASADIVVQTDADVELPRAWIARIASRFEREPTLIGLTGNMRDSRGRLVESLTAQMANLIFPGMESTTAFRRDAYVRTAGYNPAIPIHFGGDVEFWRRLCAEGRCVHDPRLVVRHHSSMKWKLMGLALILLELLGATLILAPLLF
jgi:glycosyltransferase involved in cell wall biosynthesis